jgi:hypothetical protein
MGCMELVVNPKILWEAGRTVRHNTETALLGACDFQKRAAACWSTDNLARTYRLPEHAI